MGGWFQRGGVGVCPPAQQHFQPPFPGAARPTGCLLSSLLCYAGSRALGEAPQGYRPPCTHGFRQQLDGQTGRRRSAISGCSGRRESEIRVLGDAASEKFSAGCRCRLLQCPHLGGGALVPPLLRKPWSHHGTLSLTLITPRGPASLHHHLGVKASTHDPVGTGSH